jgi:hypothetical protein
MTHDNPIAHVLAVEPSTRGLSYAVFDQRRRLLDWGGHEVRVGKNQGCRRIARRLCLGFNPRFVVLEDGDAASSKRKARIRELLRAIAQDSGDDGHIVVRIPRLSVRQRFCVYGIGSRDDIATAVCEKYPELSARLPKRRHTWESEHYSLALFEAVAIGVTFFDSGALKTDRGN